MSYPITLIYNNSGEYAGYYTSNTCVAAPSNDPAPKAIKPQVQPQVVAKATPKEEAGVWQAFAKFLFSGGLTAAPLVGCNTATSGDPIALDGGWGPVPPDVPDGAEEVPDCPGCYEVDGGIIPPVDEDGNPILFDGAFDVVIHGDGVESNFSQAAPILLEFPYLYGGNLQNKKLRMEISWVPGNIAEMPPGACHKGLLPVAQLSPEAQALTTEEKELYGITYCPEVGYENFVACPHEEYGNQITTLLGGFTLLNGEFNGEDVVPNGEDLDVTNISPAEVDEAPNSSATLAFEIPVSCGSDPQVIEIPLTQNAEEGGTDLSWWEDGNLWLKFNPLELIGRSTNFVDSQTYKNHLRVRLVLVED